MQKIPQSDIAFSQVREDCQIEWQVLDRLSQLIPDRPLRILVVASGGCTALNLLAHPRIGKITAVDANPAQLQLLNLRCASIAHLSTVSQHCLIASGGNSGQEQRLDLYNQLRPTLSKDTRIFWDQRLDEIAFGINQVGRFEQLFRLLAQAFADQGLDPLNDPANAIQSKHWRLIFEQVFDREILVQTFGESAVNYSMDRSFGDHFADVFARALQRDDYKQNYFLTQIWNDRYEGEMPMYLKPETQSILRSSLGKLQIKQSSFVNFLTDHAKNESYDLIQFSNLSDWMPIVELKQMLTQINDCLSPQGAVIGRRLNGDHDLNEVMADFFNVDLSWSHQLQLQDRSFFYQEVVVGWK